MNPKAIVPLLLLAGLAACDKPHSQLFAERSIGLVATPAQAETAPHFAGKWAAVDGQCADPWVIEARSLKHDDVTCEFDRVDPSSAGYVVSTTCTLQGKLQPGRLSVMMPDPDHSATMTLSGGPFSDATALQRCPA